MSQPWFIVLGGINGAGKSTVAEIIADDPALKNIPFLNPDRETASILAANPSMSVLAANFRGLRIVAEAIEAAFSARRSVATETVFANEAYIRLCLRAKADGYRVRLFFVGVRAVEDSIARVARRVVKGGHDVSEADIRRRWGPAHANLARMVPIADEIIVFANTTYGVPARIVATATAGRVDLIDRDALPAVTAVLAPLVPPG